MNLDLEPRVWDVGVLCRAIADALQSRFNVVAVRGEISGFSRAASGHCYFAIKDSDGQLRCAMFRRAAGALAFTPRDGMQVEVVGRVSVYEARGELQFIVEAMRQAGQGALFEQFLRLKQRLEAEGLFDSARKRAIHPMPRGIGLVTSVGAAALHDVVTALRRRVPHIPVVLAPAQVQGTAAPASMIAALQQLYAYAQAHPTRIDTIMLVRGGGSMEDLWAFNDEALARCIIQSPVPVISGVGHETDFTIADFCADLRAPTPTAAAELVAVTRQACLDELMAAQERLQEGVQRQWEQRALRLDHIASRLGRPSGLVGQHQRQLHRIEQQLRHSMRLRALAAQHAAQGLHTRLQHAVRLPMSNGRNRLEQVAMRLALLDPQLTLQRGYAILQDGQGRPVTHAEQVRVGDAVRARLQDGVMDLEVRPTRLW